jgi:NADH:ubiquinone oxidoreductase subunit F (NADH-binding)
MPVSTSFRLLEAETEGAIDRARAMGPDEVIAVVERARVRGRGGAGFPLADKLRAVRAAANGGQAFVVANAYDADPGSPLSRTLLERRPELVIDGIAIAARTVGAAQTYLYMHPEATEARSSAEGAITRRAEELAEAGVSIEIAIGPGGFMGGEESAMLAVLESRRAMARQRPPFPAEQGLRLRPTLVSCAETLAPLPLIVRDGPEAFRIAGTSASRGTKLVSVTGAVAQPGVYEVNFGSTLGEIIEAAGGVTGAVKAIHVGGPTGGLLNASRIDTRLDYEDLEGDVRHLRALPRRHQACRRHPRGYLLQRGTRRRPALAGRARRPPRRLLHVRLRHHQRIDPAHDDERVRGRLPRPHPGSALPDWHLLTGAHAAVRDHDSTMTARVKLP